MYSCYKSLKQVSQFLPHISEYSSVPSLKKCLGLEIKLANNWGQTLLFAILLVMVILWFLTCSVRGCLCLWCDIVVIIPNIHHPCLHALMWGSPSILQICRMTKIFWNWLTIEKLTDNFFRQEIFFFNSFITDKKSQNYPELWILSSLVFICHICCKKFLDHHSSHQLSLTSDMSLQCWWYV